MRMLMARWLGLLHWRRRKDELEEELQFHLEREAEENVRRGMQREQARAAATRSLGGMERVHEKYREQAGLAPFDTLLQDVGYGGTSNQSCPHRSTYRTPLRMSHVAAGTSQTLRFARMSTLKEKCECPRRSIPSTRSSTAR